MVVKGKELYFIKWGEINLRKQKYCLRVVQLFPLKCLELFPIRISLRKTSLSQFFSINTLIRDSDFSEVLPPLQSHMPLIMIISILRNFKSNIFSPSRVRRLGVVEGGCRSSWEAVQTLPEALRPEVEMYEDWCHECNDAEYSWQYYNMTEHHHEHRNYKPTFSLQHYYRHKERNNRADTLGSFMSDLSALLRLGRVQTLSKQWVVLTWEWFRQRSKNCNWLKTNKDNPSPGPRRADLRPGVARLVTRDVGASMSDQDAVQ